jgi:hypothetical protein
MNGDIYTLILLWYKKPNENLKIGGLHYDIKENWHHNNLSEEKLKVKD